MKNAEQEITKISEFIDIHRIKQKQKLSDMRNDYERKMHYLTTTNKQLNERVKQLEMQIENNGYQNEDNNYILIDQQNESRYEQQIKSPMKTATNLIRKAYSPGRHVQKDKSKFNVTQRSMSHPGVGRDNRMLRESIRHKE